MIARLSLAVLTLITMSALTCACGQEKEPAAAAMQVTLGVAEQMVNMFRSSSETAGDQPAGVRANAPDPIAKIDLTPESFPKLHALIRPHENEWRHLKVEWLTDVVAARKKAAAEDKPIVICYTGGAGYNEPLGVC
jgi:hypothetical protein